MSAYPSAMVLHPKLNNKKKDIPVYAGRELILRRDLNLRSSEDNSEGTSSELPTYAQFKPCVHWDKIALFENC